MKYFREYPWGFQLLLFLLMVFTMISAGSAFVYALMPKLSGFTMQQLQTIDEHSPAKLVKASIVVQGFLSIFIFLLPSLLFAYLATPRPGQYLGLRAPGKSIQLLLSITIMIGAMPVLTWLASMIGKIDFGAGVKASQKANDNIMKAYLNVPTMASMLRALVVMAIIPAVGEELFFRGTLMRLARKRSNSMVVPIIFTAAVFAYAHTNIYGYLSIFLAGVLLAVIYVMTSSIWCSIAAHLFFNGLQVVMAFMASTSAAQKGGSDDSVPLWLVFAGLAVFCGSFYLLMKNKTPLPADWANDFDKNEVRAAEGE